MGNGVTLGDRFCFVCRTRQTRIESVRFGTGKPLVRKELNKLASLDHRVPPKNSPQNFQTQCHSRSGGPSRTITCGLHEFVPISKDKDDSQTREWNAARNTTIVDRTLQRGDEGSTTALAQLNSNVTPLRSGGEYARQ